jgi:hypothetical protein
MERAGAAKIALYQMDAKVRELHVNGAESAQTREATYTIGGF